MPLNGHLGATRCLGKLVQGNPHICVIHVQVLEKVEENKINIVP